ncbi:aspartate/glutamate racemase family protein [Winogradskyella litoriviva]|uniref:Aspartate/glutamate racemase family protein n=1 Tax=Winogradskyella litoriviva TaxID=1220182 RepID=A0ABX2E5Q1_9FLAO|nr:aspartate/glutamate racemase family protein [Winogradskyella litoriviva]NRD23649.1 aspartate/glutamate racemase family protein [Winogradskyella litoriviva]
MSKLGVLGLGSFSTLFYIKELNALYNKKHGGFSTCPFTMLNINFDAINNLLPNTSNHLDNLVLNPLNKLAQLNVHSIIVPNITLHETLDRLNIPSNIIHPVTQTIIKLKDDNHRHVTVFGSLYTMQSNYISSAFKSHHISVLQPSEEDRLIIENLRVVIYNGTETTEQLATFRSLIAKYTQNGAVVFACTELSVAYNNQNNLVYDMARIQINTAIYEL